MPPDARVCRDLAQRRRRRVLRRGRDDLRPGTNFVQANVPLKKGSNVSDDARDHDRFCSAPTRSRSTSANSPTTSPKARRGFFDTDMTLATSRRFYRAGRGSTSCPRHAPRAVRRDGLTERAAADTVDNTVPDDAACRRRAFDERRAARGRTHDDLGRARATAVTAAPRSRPVTRWLFAEGSQGFFQTFVLLANDHAAAVTATITLPARRRRRDDAAGDGAGASRHTIYAGDIPAARQSIVRDRRQASRPIIAERAMYLPGAARCSRADTSRPASTRPAAAGSSRKARRTPSSSASSCSAIRTTDDANVTLTYLLPSGATFARTSTSRRTGRQTINVETVDPRLANTPCRRRSCRTRHRRRARDVLARHRGGLAEAHNSFGVTEAALRWGVADGRIGGPRGYRRISCWPIRIRAGGSRNPPSFVPGSRPSPGRINSFPRAATTSG